MDTPLTVNLLGSVEIRRAGQLVRTGGGRMTVVLAMLALSVGRPVGASALIEAVWDSHLPQSAAGSLQNHVLRLRRMLGASTIRTTSAGYLLDLEPDQVDLWRFRRLADEATAITARDPQAARALLVEALALWRGEPLDGLASEELRRDAVPALIEERLAALDRRIELDFAAGRHADTIVELRATVAKHPLRETSWWQLIAALAAAGRKAEALDRYHEIQARLRDQLGTYPSTELRALHQQLLRHDEHRVPDQRPEPESGPRPKPEPASTPAPPPTPSPTIDSRSDLPGDIADLTGRREAVAWLLAALPKDPAQALAPTVMAIDGMAGVGKTALVVHLAHRLAARCPDGQLFIDLRGHTPGHRPVEPAAALSSLLTKLGVTDNQIPDTLEDRAALWRAKLAGRRMLVLLDNAASTAQVRSLLPGAAGCLVLITSRRRLLALNATRSLSLDVLPPDDALHLLGAITGRHRLDAEPEATREVLDLCGNLPLAIRIAGARLAARPAWSITHLAERLRDQRHRLSELAAEDSSVATAFTVSYQQLTTDQQFLFRALGAHPGPDFDRFLAAAVAGIAPATAEQGLEDFLDAHLLMQPAVDRYRFHDLLRAHARHPAEPTAPPPKTSDADPDTDKDTDTERRTAIARLLDYYLAASHQAANLISPTTRKPEIRLAHPPEAIPPMANRADAIAWCEQERPNLVAAIVFAAAEGWYTHAWQLPWLVGTFFHLRGHFQDWITIGQQAHGALDHATDPAARPEILRSLGLAYHHVGRSDEAVDLLDQARTSYEANDDWDGQAEVSGDLGLLAINAGRYTEAIGHHWLALELFQRAKTERDQEGSLLGEATNLLSVGNALLMLGRHHGAIGYHQRALAVSREIGDRRGEGVAAVFLALSLQRSGRIAEAFKYHQLALRLNEENGDRPNVAVTLNFQGLLYRQRGKMSRALDHHRQSLELVREIGERSSEAAIINDYAATLLLAGQQQESVARYREALDLSATIVNRYEQARAHHGLSRALMTSDARQADEHRQMALAIFSDLGVPEAADLSPDLSPTQAIETCPAAAAPSPS